MSDDLRIGSVGPRRNDNNEYTTKSPHATGSKDNFFKKLLLFGTNGAVLPNISIGEALGSYTTAASRFDNN